MNDRLAIGLLLAAIGVFPGALAFSGTISSVAYVSPDSPATAAKAASADDEPGQAEPEEQSVFSADESCEIVEPSLWASHRNKLAVHAWLDQGFTWNPDRPSNRFNTPVTFNDRADEYQMNQLYVGLERLAGTDPHAWDVGGRIDFLYGTDYFFTTATGLETRRDGTPHWNSARGPRGAGAALYGLAMPQVYAEVFAPIGQGLSVKMGHFYTIMGYETVMAPDNFFYSHSYTMQYGEPFTHTGLLADWAISDRVSVMAGFTRGWDSWEDFDDKLGFLGGVCLSSRDRRTLLAFTLHTGAEDDAGQHNRTTYSLVLTRQLTCRLKYVFQHDLGIEQNAALDSDLESIDAYWYGINQYLFYQLNRTTALGLRFEWFRDQDNARVLGIPVELLVDGGNYYQLTFGMNWEPNEHVILRPELRWDWSDVEAPLLNVDGMYDAFSDKNQFTLGIDLIVRY